MKKTKHPTIRTLTTEDIEQICAIARKAWEGIHDGYRKYINNDDLYNRMHSDWRTQKNEQIRKKSRAQPDEVLVAEIDGRIAGFITFNLNHKTGIGEILNNAVDPEYHGQGIGQHMYRAVLEIFRTHNMQYAIVSTGYEDEGHAKARAAYEKVGFKKVQTSVTYSLRL